MYVCVYIYIHTHIQPRYYFPSNQVVFSYPWVFKEVFSISALSLPGFSVTVLPFSFVPHELGFIVLKSDCFHRL